MIRRVSIIALAMALGSGVSAGEIDPKLEAAIRAKAAAVLFDAESASDLSPDFPPA